MDNLLKETLAQQLIADGFDYSSEPTIAQAVKYLYFKYGIWISVGEKKSGWQYKIRRDLVLLKAYKRCGSPVRAYEMAIQHVANHYMLTSKRKIH